jgi:predicted enzyme related to lactoylglutathione lyase
LQLLKLLSENWLAAFQEETMSIDNALASVPVKNLQAAVAWYEQVLERPADSRPMPEVAEWQFPRGGWLQVYQLAERAGCGSFTLAVTDIDEIIERARKLGIDTSQKSSSPKVKTLMITDPDGNHISFAQTLGKTIAR